MKIFKKFITVLILFIWGAIELATLLFPIYLGGTTGNWWYLFLYIGPIELLMWFEFLILGVMLTFSEVIGLAWR